MQYILVLLGNIAFSVFGCPLDTTVSTSSGIIADNARNEDGILEFLGIPFAAPPIGNLRWKPPQPVLDQHANINATTFGPGCLSASPESGYSGPQSEDCLTLNVWSSSDDSNEKRPVMVWLYGGGFQFGSSAQPNYNGTKLSQMGVVVVTFNYRLGALGFLGLPELDNEGPNSGNFGLQDQLAALSWVQENIANFGGDPDNVAVFGESAGAHAIGLLTASDLSRGLFQRCILQSGAYWDSEHGSLETFSGARTRGENLKQKLGVSSLAELRSLSANTVNNAALWNSSTDPGVRPLLQVSTNMLYLHLLQQYLTVVGRLKYRCLLASMPKKRHHYSYHAPFHMIRRRSIWPHPKPSLLRHCARPFISTQEQRMTKPQSLPIHLLETWLFDNRLSKLYLGKQPPVDSRVTAIILRTHRLTRR